MLQLHSKLLRNFFTAAKKNDGKAITQTSFKSPDIQDDCSLTVEAQQRALRNLKIRLKWQDHPAQTLICVEDPYTTRNFGFGDVKACFIRRANKADENEKRSSEAESKHEFINVTNNGCSH